MQITKEQKLEKGITLVSLVITIVIMLILASVIVNVSIDGGLFGYAKNGKDSMEVANERETIQKAVIILKDSSKTGRITLTEIQKAIDNDIGEGIATAIDTGDAITIKFNESNRCYDIDSEGNVEYLGVLVEKTLTVQCVDSTGGVIDEKEYQILKNNYSIIPPQIEGYESAVETIGDEITENTTITQLYYKMLQDDTTLVFTGLDSSGTITTTESEIISYMIGSGSTTSRNGIKSNVDQTVEAVLKIPDTYNGKPVTQIGSSAFANSRAINKIIIPDSVTTINGKAFYYCEGVKEFTMGANVTKIDSLALWYLNNLKTVIYNGNIIADELGHCSQWTEVKLGENNTAYKIDDKIIYSSDGTKLWVCPRGRTKDVVIPEGVTIIEKGAFSSCSLIKNIEIADTVTRIENNAFLGCDSLEKIIIPDNVSVINSKSFYDCSKIKEAIIGVKVTAITTFAFRGCDELTTLKIDSPTIVSNLTSQTACGYVANAATTIYIKKSITTIGSYISDNFSIDTTYDTEDEYVKYVKNAEQAT